MALGKDNAVSSAQETALAMTARGRAIMLTKYTTAALVTQIRRGAHDD